LIFKEIERNARKKRRRTKTHQHSDARSSQEEYRRVVASIVTHDGFNTKNVFVFFDVYVLLILNKGSLLMCDVGFDIVDFLSSGFSRPQKHQEANKAKTFRNFEVR